MLRDLRDALDRGSVPALQRLSRHWTGAAQAPDALASPLRAAAQA
jgi:hypothetical protein